MMLATSRSWVRLPGSAWTNSKLLCVRDRFWVKSARLDTSREPSISQGFVAVREGLAKAYESEAEG